MVVNDDVDVVEDVIRVEGSLQQVIAITSIVIAVYRLRKQAAGHYEHIPNDALCRLFSIYCSFYGSQLWGSASEGFSRCVTEWNKAVRRVLQVSNCTH